MVTRPFISSLYIFSICILQTYPDQSFAMHNNRTQFPAEEILKKKEKKRKMFLVSWYVFFCYSCIILAIKILSKKYVSAPISI